jgi:hypothetical protein
MPASARFFTEAPRQGEMRQMARDEVAALARASQLSSFEVTQRLPEGLTYIEDSAQPAPSVASDGEQVVLRWQWQGAAASGAQTVTYGVEPLAEGVWAIDGHVTFVDALERRRVLPVPERAITVAGLCEPLVTPPTPTPTPAPPTDTPEPPTATTVPPTATAVPTPVPMPLFLPVALRFTCRPDERHGDIALVIDASSSMDRLTPDGPTKKEAVLEAARTFVSRLSFVPNELGRHDQLAIVGFHDEAWLEQALTSDPADAENALARLYRRQGSGTRLDLAFDAGLAALDPGLRRPGNKPVIILLTDGVPNRVPPHPGTGRAEDTVIEAARRAHEAGVTVYTIGFGHDDERADPADRVNAWLLEQCASDPSKAYIDPRADRLREIYAEIAEVFGCPPAGWP